MLNEKKKGFKFITINYCAIGHIHKLFSHNSVNQWSPATSLTFPNMPKSSSVIIQYYG